MNTNINVFSKNFKKYKHTKNIQNNTYKKIVFENALKNKYRKTCIFASLCLQTIINILVQVIFGNLLFRSHTQVTNQVANYAKHYKDFKMK
jgi:hypothetical protein